MSSLDGLASEIERDGCATLSGILDPEACEHLLAVLAARETEWAGWGGARNLFEIDAIREVALSQPIRRVAETVLGRGCSAVRALLFDKTASANWGVAWHQDLAVAVQARNDAVPGFGPWSIKAGVVHAVAPASVLERMLTIRLHLDACGPENGPLRVVAGSHRNGRIGAEDWSSSVWRGTQRVMTVERGGVVIFRPLLLHASSPAEQPSRRRVLHLEYASADALSAPLLWRWSLGSCESSEDPVAE
ncbi:MAG: phytanoyl-CoA dioxygenase family protein [Isosphaeraceae bacterium]|nr:phytanoyl-CoA dioxygenase family protein [Isosphaeraceae bacterium]